MKLCMLETNASPGERSVGALTEGGVVDLTPALGEAAALPLQARMVAVIDGFDGLRPELDRLVSSGPTHADGEFRLRAPLPRPSKILCCIGNYWEHAERDPRPLNMFLKSSDAVIGPGRHGRAARDDGSRGYFSTRRSWQSSSKARRKA